MCGAHLKEPRKKGLQAPETDLLLPFLMVLALVALWLWKPWDQEESLATAPATASATAEVVPVATFAVAPTATPLHSPTPLPTSTLPPNQTRHKVESGETVSAIAKRYGTTIKAILQANQLKDTSTLRPGDELIVPLPVAQTLTPTPTLTPSPTPAIYTIKSGDTLSAIAKRFNTTVEALMVYNSISDATNLRVGTKLTIVQPPDLTANMAYETYEIQQGDTLYQISAKYGVPVAQIRKINGLKSDRLSVGQKLQIPVGTATPAPTPTSTVSPTPTPGPARPAPMLLTPPNEATFEGPDVVVLLSWASVGILDDDEWYVVRVRRIEPGGQQPPLVWTKSTAWRLPAELYVAGLPDGQLFRWQVTVMRQTGVDDDGTWIGQRVSPESETRTFTWK